MAQAQTTGGTGAREAAAKIAAIFDLKSATLNLLSLVLKSADPQELATALQAKLGDTPEMFNGDPVLIDLSQLERAPAPEGEAAQMRLDEVAADVDLAAIVALLQAHRMQAVAVLGASDSELEQARKLGLADAAADAVTTQRGGESRVETVVQQVEVVREVIREVAIPGEPAKTMIIDKPLRSGQQVYAKGADLIVMALVNHGAEVIADGNIHVYAPLRGKAIAGARGNTDARIFATSMEAELIAIAGIYRTTENPLPESVLGKPAQIRLEGEKLVMEALKF